jgi:hypothetical protein
MAAADYMTKVMDECTRVDTAEFVVATVVPAAQGDTLVDWLVQVRRPLFLCVSLYDVG